jgi:hypothetical protein
MMSKCKTFQACIGALNTTGLSFFFSRSSFFKREEEDVWKEKREIFRFLS